MVSHTRSKAPHTAVFFFILVSSLCCPSHAGWNGWDKELDWWQDTIVYQVYPASFQDSDGDGIGDLRGILSRLDYFVESGIKTFWVSPIFKSPMADLGYDVSDFESINNLFGNMEDFKELMKAVREKGLRILMDFVPNHTSNEHDWFKRSVRNETPYKDYYIWKNGRNQPDGSVLPPNNWLSLFGGSGWTFVPERGQYYYHQFSVKQPDLDFRNPKVREEMYDVLKYWLDLGVDGFRMDAVKHLMEDSSFNDETYIDPRGNHMSYLNMYHNLTTDWHETYDLIYEWRQFLDNYASNSSDTHTRLEITTKIGNHDNHRVATRLGEDMVDAMAMLSMLLPGTSVTYQGEELGQPDTLIRRDQIKDPNNNGLGVLDVRDPQRGPFLWNDSENAGFTSRKKPWEPIHPSYWKLNLESQKVNENSHFRIYQRLAALRKHVTIQKGTLTTHVLSEWVFAFVRRHADNDTYVVVINCGSEREVVVLRDEISRLPDYLEVVVPSLNSGYKIGDIVNPDALVDIRARLLVLRPKASVVLRSSFSRMPTPDDDGKSKKKNSSTSLQPLSTGALFFSALVLLLRLNMSWI
ncbi:maltase 2 [Nilaparvata lugens]|uniref:maltase 2 n=1 Tax=Nilaparvata lugens TaxID=108931 RepID=UPI00193EB5A3|nr:maltase 2 [Nilaparvata lugens]